MSKKNLKELQTTDTTLYMPPFKYLLKPKDIVSISFTSITKGEYDLSSLSQQSNTSSSNQQSGNIIDDNGNILLPVLGKIKIAGMTIQDAQIEVQKTVDKYLENVTANVRMLNFNVIMMGEISTQGRIVAPNDQLTLLEAVALSGGFKEYANRNKIKIIRTDDYKVHIYYVDMTNEDILTKKEVYLLPGDIVMVEPMRSRNIRTYSLTNIALLTSSFSLILLLSVTLRNILK